MIASRLNGLVSIGAVTQPEARVAHEILANGDAFSWELNPDLEIMLPYARWLTIKQAFNRPEVPPVRVEFSSILKAERFKPREIGSFIRRAAWSNVATVVSRFDIMHDVVIDSRSPTKHQLTDVGGLLDYIGQDTDTRIQMFHEKW